MNDTIYRQAAIDAVCAVCGNDCDKSEFVYNAPQDEQVIICPEHYVLCTLPSAQSEITLESAIDYLHSIGWMQNHDRILSEAAQPDAVTASLEELINDYGEDGYLIVDGVNYHANELLNELKINSSVGEKFRKQITKTIVAYFMKFGD